ncbi:helix-turn-helix domain-containing protein [Microbacterium sp. NPDC056052]|uniref:AraC family transcriptional regulator n=1 Tax=Microbacterium sp. NPDC056052 TaxID=3345695 RepID=UPI0035DEF25E
MSTVTIAPHARLQDGMLPAHDGLRLYIVIAGRIALSPNLADPDHPDLPEGTGFVCSDPRRPEILARHAASLIVLSAPSELWQRSGLSPDRAHLLPASATWLRPTAVFAATLHALAGSAADCLLIERLLSVLLLRNLTQAPRSQQPPRDPERFVSALAAIAARYPDPELRPATVARTMNISLRQLERAFHVRDTTIAREIRRTRVERALGLLTDGEHQRLTVTAVARLVGFRDGAGLARAMRAEHAPTPARARRAAGF